MRLYVSRLASLYFTALNVFKLSSLHSLLAPVPFLLSPI